MSAASRGMSGVVSEIDAFVARELEDGAIPGAAVGVSVEGETVFAQAWGTYPSSDGGERPLTPETIHLLYSFSKPITSTVVVAALEHCGLALDDHVERYIPGYG